MSTKARRINLYAVDWVVDVSGHDLGAAAVGVYIQIHALCYATNSPSLPVEPTVRRIANQFGDDPRTIRAAIGRLARAGKLTVSESSLEPVGIREELDRAQRRSSTASRPVGTSPSPRPDAGRRRTVEEWLSAHERGR